MKRYLECQLFVIVLLGTGLYITTPAEGLIKPVQPAPTPTDLVTAAADV